MNREIKRKIVQIVVGTAFLITSVGGFAQNLNQQTFFDLLRQNDFEALASHLERWQSDTPDDPELYVAYFNYYALRNRTGIPTMGQMPDGRHGVYNRLVYDEDDVHTGLEYLATGIEISPQRLDMYLARNYVLQQINAMELLADRILELLSIEEEQGPNWIWTNGQSLAVTNQTSEQLIVANIQDRLDVMFRNFDSFNEYISEICYRQVEVFPENTWAWNHLARYQSLSGDYDQAVLSLLTASELDPDDYLIVANIAYTYELAGDNGKAAEYYREVIENAPQRDLREYAQAGLDRLEQNR